MSDAITKLKQGQNLSFEESKSLFSDLMEGKHEEGQIIEILEALIKKGETKDELAGGIFVLRDKATKVVQALDQNDVRIRAMERSIERMENLKSDDEG